MKKEVSPSPSLKGVIRVPSDKSISQRAAIFALLHEGESRVLNYSPANDPQSTLKCVQDLGATIRQEGDELVITGTGRKGVHTPTKDIECDNSGTAMRLLSGVLVGAGITAKLCGDTSLTERPMKRIIEPLESMGAHILARNSGWPPLYISREDELNAINFELPIASAQLKSCILLAGLFGEIPTKVIETIPSRDHTERLLGLNIEMKDGKRIISSGLSDVIPAQNYTVPGDFSSASFWLVAGAISNDAEIVLEGVGLNPTRNAALHVLKEMGADITVSNQDSEGAEPVGDLLVRNSRLRAINIDPSLIPNCIDELPILAVAMLYADGTSIISGASELRHKETDRIMAISNMLKAVGADFEEKEDGVVINGDPNFEFKGAKFKSFHDHRIAMASAILALKGDKESVIKGAQHASVSYAEFWEDLESIRS